MTGTASQPKRLKIQGAVDLEAVVAESGEVEKVTVLNGNPVLTKSASEALMRWKYAPFQANGKPVKAVVPVTFNFTMK
jgi:TonB family protein